MTPFSRPAFRDTLVWKNGWRLIQKSRGLSEVLRIPQTCLQLIVMRWRFREQWRALTSTVN